MIYTQRSGARNVALQVLGWLICAAIVSAIAWYTIYIRNNLNKQSQFQISQADKSYEATRLGYKYISINKTLVLVPSTATYADNSGEWSLINKTYNLPLSFVPLNLETVTIPKFQNDATIRVQSSLIEPLNSLYDAAKKVGINLMVRSAYRSGSDQQKLYDDMQLNGSVEYVAIPGKSEHQTGLAVDFNSTDVNCGTSCSLDVTSAKWLEVHAAEYGFILRYPKDKTAITGYPAENWHFRYVGTKLALAMKQSNLTLEEVYPLFKDAKARQE
jgi:D-alanyl-D-alanine carboxypeptidase